MAFTTAFRDYLTAKLIGGTAVLYDNTNAYIGVGTSATLVSASQTNLLGTAVRKPMDTGYPTVSANTMTFRATYATGDANFSWQEWGIFNAAAGGTMMNRVTQDNGTKAATETKQVTVTMTLSI